jgi:hypothetical protein
MNHSFRRLLDLDAPGGFAPLTPADAAPPAWG